MISIAGETAFDDLCTIGGHKIHVRVDRRFDGRPLMLLNGLTRPLERWDPLVAALDDRTVVRFDPPGIGSSPSTLLPMSIAALAEIASGVLDVVEVPVSDVLGYSHGGAVAQELSHGSPDKVGSMILAATTCGIGSAFGGLEVLATMLRPERAPKGSAAKTHPVAIFYRSLAIACWTSIPFLGTISKPTLVISGDQDRLVPAINGRILAQRIPKATAITVPAGHDLQHPKCASDLAKVVSDFLDAHG